MSRRMIVVVEDEAAQRMDAVAAFNESGYDTADFDNASDAAVFIGQNKHDIFAVFTDVRMPGDLDGMNLAAQLAFGFPHIALIVTSGEAEGILERLPPKGYFVPKPWLGTDLSDAVEQVRQDSVGRA